jgi:hypothetical protein
MATKAENAIHASTVTIAIQKNNRYIETFRRDFPRRFYAAKRQNVPWLNEPGVRTTSK